MLRGQSRDKGLLGSLSKLHSRLRDLSSHHRNERPQQGADAAIGGLIPSWELCSTQTSWCGKLNSLIHFSKNMACPVARMLPKQYMSSFGIWPIEWRAELISAALSCPGAAIRVDPWVPYSTQRTAVLLHGADESDHLDDISVDSTLEVVEGGDNFAVSFLGSEFTPQFLGKPELHVDILATPLNSSVQVVIEQLGVVHRETSILFRAASGEYDGQFCPNRQAWSPLEGQHESLWRRHQQRECRDSAKQHEHQESRRWRIENRLPGWGRLDSIRYADDSTIDGGSIVLFSTNKAPLLTEHAGYLCNNMFLISFVQNQNARFLMASDLFDGHDGPGFCDRHGRRLDLDSGSHDRLCSSGPCLDLQLVIERRWSGKEQVAFHVFARPSPEDLSVKHDLEAVPDLHPAL
ncbi:aldolase, partial [Aureobasidium melanogenum]